MANHFLSLKFPDVSEKCTVLVSMFDFTKQNIMGAIFTNFECICFEL